jgi:hypothetical protein
MEATRSTVSKIQTRRQLREAIERWRNNVIDLDVLVDDKRLALNRAVDELRVAVRERDRGTEHLARLIDWSDEVEAVAETFGPEIAAGSLDGLNEASI